LFCEEHEGAKFFSTALEIDFHTHENKKVSSFFLSSLFSFKKVRYKFVVEITWTGRPPPTAFISAATAFLIIDRL